MVAKIAIAAGSISAVILLLWIIKVRIGNSAIRRREGEQRKKAHAKNKRINKKYKKKSKGLDNFGSIDPNDPWSGL